MTDSIYISPSPLNIVLLIASDPNTPKSQFIKLIGTPKNINRFDLQIFDQNIENVFSASYPNLNPTSQVFLEFFTYLNPGEYLLNLKINEFKRTISISF